MTLARWKPELLKGDPVERLLTLLSSRKMRPMVNGYVNGYLDKAKASLTEPLLDPSQRQSAMQETSWADGLRGIASLFVVSSHIVLCFARRLVLPCCGPVDGVPHLFQRPILRLLGAGYSWVAMFLVLSGFVNALKPIKLARSGQVESALTNLALSSFRRTFRLMLPAAAATTVSWFVCQLGMYELARNGDAYWLYTYTPMMSYSWGTALDDLFKALRATWTIWEINPYDQPQWALIYLLQGSMFVFCALLITLNLKPVWRMTLLAIFAVWSFDWSVKYHDPLVGFTIFSGILLTELSYTSLPALLAPYSPILSPPLAFLGLFLMSQPSDHPQSAPWSARLDALGARLFPPQGDMARTWGSVGCLILLLAILISPHFRRLLARPALLWLGRVSFPVYLLHGTFMRSLMAWFVFAGRTPRAFEVPLATADAPGETYSVHRYPQPGSARILLSVALSMGCMLAAAHYWTKNVEPVFARLTKWAEERMVGTGSGRGEGKGVAADPGRAVLPVGGRKPVGVD